MARPMIQDPYHNFRFHVKASPAGSLQPFGPTIAGFTKVTLPGIKSDKAEYKEGIMVYKRKFQGQPEFDDLTLSRGVTTDGSDFYNWMEQAVQGGEYRIDLEIHQFHRTDVSNQADYSGLTASRVIKCSECLPMEYKPGEGLDTGSNDIAIQEITIAVEHVEVTNKLK